MCERLKIPVKWVCVFWVLLGISILLWNAGYLLKPIFCHWAYVELSKWQTGIGALVTGGVAIFVIRHGYQINARLNRENAYTIAQLDRNRDEWIKNEEAKAVAAAMAAEIAAIGTIEKATVKEFEKAIRSASDGMVQIVNLVRLVQLAKDRTVYNQLAPKLGELPNSYVAAIVRFHQVSGRMDAMAASFGMAINKQEQVASVETVLKKLQEVVYAAETLSRILYEYAHTGQLTDEHLEQIFAIPE